MSVAPGASAVTTPAVSTLATAGSRETQSTGTWTGRPNASSACAATCRVSPAHSVSSAGVTTTLATASSGPRSSSAARTSSLP